MSVSLGIIWICILFLTIGTVAGDFFAVNLTTIARSLHLSDTLAGVTVLAIGNGSPDIFSTFAAVSSGSSSMAVGELVGAAGFIATVIAGSMALVKPFEIRRDPFLRDAAFLIATLALMLSIVLMGTLQTWHCALMVALYVLYVTTVMLYHWWLTRRDRQDPSRPLKSAGHIRDGGPENGYADENQRLLSPSAGRRAVAERRTNDQGNGDGIYPTANGYGSLQESQGDAPKAPSAMSSLTNALHAVLPSLKDAKAQPKWRLAVNIITAPFMLILRLTIPVVDNSETPDEIAPQTDTPAFSEHSKESPEEMQHPWLLAVQIFAAPQFVHVLFWLDGDQGTKSLLQNALYIVGISVLLTILVALTSTSTHRSQWQPLVSAAGFGMSAFWLDTVANEVVALLKAFGIIANVSEQVLGYTVFALGNSIDDFAANLAVARHGHPVMAFAACFGGPLTNMLFGLGVGGLYSTLRRGTPLEIQYSVQLLVLSGGLMATLVILALALWYNGWRVNRKIGAGLIIIWVASAVTNVVLEVVG